MVMPVTPASPKKRAYSDQANAASVPMEMSVSMVAAPWRRFVHAARWNGNAPHTTTGAARVRANHCQLSNCSAGIIDIATTGSASAAEIASRFRSSSVSSASSPEVASSPPASLLPGGTVAW